MTTLKKIQEAAKLQGVTLSVEEIKHIFILSDLVEGNRKLQNRVAAMKVAGYRVAQKPMHTGYGRTLCMKRMQNGNLRIRVSANWTCGHGNYANCVEV